MRLIALLASLSGVLALSWSVRWLVETHPTFGMGFCCGVMVAGLLYWLCEYLGLTRVTD